MWESRQKAELNSAHTAANGLNFYSSGKASMNVLSSRKFHVTHGRDIVTAAVEVQVMQNIIILSI